MGEPVYVLKIDTKNNTITIGKREDSMRSKIKVSGINWHLPAITEPKKCFVKIRYASKKTEAVVSPDADGACFVEFIEPQFAPTPGQAAVFYDDEFIIGGGWIEEVV